MKKQSMLFKVSIFAVVFFLLSILPLKCQAQTTTVSGTAITDSDSTVWANAAITFTFVPSPNYPNLGPTQRIYQTSLDGSGTFSVMVADNATYGGSSYAITICSYTSAPCSVLPNTSVTGTTFSLTSYIESYIKAPRFPINGINIFGYADVEVSPVPSPGATYYNVVLAANRQWNGSSWITSGAANNPFLISVLAYGAKCDGSTNDLTAIQNTFAAVASAGTGQVVFPGNQTCNIAGTITIPANDVGFTCSTNSITGVGSIACTLAETTAATTAISDTGHGNGKFENLNIKDTATQSGTPSGLFMLTGNGNRVQNVTAIDFYYPFYISNEPSSSNGGFYNDHANWTSLSSSLSAPVGFYLYSGNGLPEDSLTIRDSGVTQGSGSAGCIGMLLYGTAVNDVNTFNFNVAGCADGQDINYTGTATGFAASDIHFISTTIDSFTNHGMDITGSSQANVKAAGGSLSIIDARISTQQANTGGILFNTWNGAIIEGSQFSINNGQYDLRSFSSGNFVIDGNTFAGINGSGVTNGIYANPLTNSTISGNSFGQYLTNAINLDSSSTNIIGLDTNSFDSTLTVAHQVVNAGANNPGSYTAQTVVNCSTSGTVTFSQPSIGPSYKQVLVYFNACLGTFSYTYPTAFTNTPQLVSQTITTGVMSTISTTATSGTGATTTGFATLMGY